VATQQVQSDLINSLEFLGELGLFGELRAVTGALACAIAAHQAKRKLVVPKANEEEAQYAPRGTLLIAGNLRDVVEGLRDHSIGSFVPTAENSTYHAALTRISSTAKREELSTAAIFNQVIGQHAAKRALTIAAAGGHHLLMVGPPGTGKTTLARGFCQLLPPLSPQQSMEVAALYSVAGLTRANHTQAPFRDPHHSASATSLIGGGHPPIPGEVALANHGVLFLDELPHFKPSALNLLREPIESGEAVITRAKYKIRFPCRFQLIAAMNPCPAGRTCSTAACRCTSTQLQRYQSRISGPMLDRIDLQVYVPSLPKTLLAQLNQKKLPHRHQSISQTALLKTWSKQERCKCNAKAISTPFCQHTFYPPTATQRVSTFVSWNTPLSAMRCLPEVCIKSGESHAPSLIWMVRRPFARFILARR